ncbi:maleylpyruvate isomerase N-terminal domain-containing protein [Nocardioides marmoriginsengisoli]|uniref:maleylpyruvate isomerase N-terminal domain-containing protein n=1 Tax=Nocardioides marmoriginsengisoli TaxID=661483 RepID=UPI00160E93AA|nr:maleylpyruvate isomerase N-terminal domain-containing protein [Nocardioides marmoriginsengisoli]
MTQSQRVEAFRRERRALSAVLSTLETSEWATPSAAADWTVHDVVAHMSVGCKALLTPAILDLVRSSDIEATNEGAVASRRHWDSDRLVAEYERWSSAALRCSAVVGRTPLIHLRVPLAELGRFRLGVMLPGAMFFDHHIHLRHDILTVIDRDADGSDALRSSVVVEWMVAVMTNQMRADGLPWLDAPMNLTLVGDGGGSWTVEPGGLVTAGLTPGAPTAVRAAVEDFPIWGTARTPWTDHRIEIAGPEESVIRFLDGLNIV